MALEDGFAQDCLKKLSRLLSGYPKYQVREPLTEVPSYFVLISNLVWHSAPTRYKCSRSIAGGGDLTAWSYGGYPNSVS